MKFMSKAIVIAFVALLAGNLVSAASLPKGKEILVEDEQLSEVFNALGAVPVSDSSAASLATRYGHALEAYYGKADGVPKAAMLDQVRGFIRAALVKCVKNLDEVKSAIELYIIDNQQVPFDESLRDQLKNDLDQIVQEKELSWIEEEFKPELQKCSEFFLSERAKNSSPALRKIMIKKLEKLIKHGGQVFGRAVQDKKISERDFVDGFYDPVQDIVTKIDGDETTYSERIRQSVTDKYADSIDWYDQLSSQEESSSSSIMKAAVLGLMASSAIHGIASQFNQPKPNVNVAASGLEVDDQAVPAQTIDTSAQLIDVSDVDVVHQPSVAEPQVIVPAPDAVDLMRAGTTTQTPTELPVTQSYGPRPTLGESVKNMVTGNTPPAFYDPVQHSGFDINKVQETKQAEERQAAEEARVEKEKRRAEKDRRWAENEERAAKLAVGYRKINEIGQEKIKATMIEQNHLPKGATIVVEREWSEAGGLIPNEDNANGLRVSATFTYKDSDGCQISVPCIFEESQGGVYGSREYLGRTGVARNIALEQFKQKYPGVEKLSIYSDVERNQNAYVRGEINNSDIMVVIQVPEWQNRALSYYVEPQEINQKMSESTGSSSSWKFW